MEIIITINCSYVSNYYTHEVRDVMSISYNYIEYTFIWITYGLNILVNERETNHVNQRMNYEHNEI